MIGVGDGAGVLIDHFGVGDGGTDLGVGNGVEVGTGVAVGYALIIAWTAAATVASISSVGAAVAAGVEQAVTIAIDTTRNGITCSWLMPRFPNFSALLEISKKVLINNESMLIASRRFEGGIKERVAGSPN